MAIQYFESQAQSGAVVEFTATGGTIDLEALNILYTDGTAQTHTLPNGSTAGQWLQIRRDGVNDATLNGAFTGAETTVVLESSGDAWFRWDGAAWEPRSEFGSGADPVLSGSMVVLAASRNLAISDLNSIIESSQAADVTLTIPADASLNWPVGPSGILSLSRYGAGGFLIAAGPGVTIRSEGNKLSINAQYQSATLYKRAANEWVLSGAIA